MNLERLKSVFGRSGQSGENLFGLDPKTQLIRLDQVAQYHLPFLQARHRSNGYGLSRQAIDLRATVFDISRHPHFKDNPLTLTLLGQWFARRGHFAEALFLQSRALSLYPLTKLDDFEFRLPTVRDSFLQTLGLAHLPDRTFLEGDIEVNLAARIRENLGRYLTGYPQDKPLQGILTHMTLIPDPASSD